jgi:hypothetical protein
MGTKSDPHKKAGKMIGGKIIAGKIRIEDWVKWLSSPSQGIALQGESYHSILQDSGNLIWSKQKQI